MPNSKPSRKPWRSSAVITNRARELRRQMTPAERKLWARVRNHQLDGLHIRRQFTLERFIADFYYAPSRLVIEIDGDVHAEQVEHDEVRTEWLIERGYQVIRFTNEDVMKRLESVLEKIREACRKTPPP